jgi:HAD superfamily hydrolase (TIGR01549 family)
MMHMPQQQIDSGSLKTILFDVDGTLYRQSPLRRAMLRRLITAHIFRPMQGWRTLSALRAYRHAQERLRGRVCDDIGTEQLSAAAAQSGIAHTTVAQAVEQWMEQEPLVFLPGCLQPGVVDFLAACRTRKIRMGAVSDYPAEAKLRAMGLLDFFDVVLSAQSSDVGVFKPDPKGISVALKRLGAAPGDTLYVGDRVDVDAAAAEAAGVRCAILTSRPPSAGQTYFAIASFAQLHQLLWG